MGYGGYSHEAHEALTTARAALPRQEVFKQKKCHPLMDPQGLVFREARDSATHPESLAVVLALDVTGSMGKLPELLARKELPEFMRVVLEAGVKDPQVLFLAVGDATCDRAPLQVGQFESAAREMDQWLTWSCLEGGGGAHGCESYELALYVAARHTAIDCWEKRGRRGYFFLTGDEHPYPSVARAQVASLLGTRLPEDLPLPTLLEELSVRYEPFFVIPDQARRAFSEARWRELLGSHVLCLHSPEDFCLVTAGAIALTEGAVTDLDAYAKRLRDAGTSAERAGRVVRALSDYAATTSRDGAPRPNLRNEGLARS